MADREKICSFHLALAISEPEYLPTANLSGIPELFVFRRFHRAAKV